MFRISGGINCLDSVENSDTGGPSSIIVRMEYLRAFQYWYCELSVKNWWDRRHCFVNFCSLAVLESSVNEGWWEWCRNSYLGLAEIISFSSGSFSHLNQNWFKCKAPLLHRSHRNTSVLESLFNEVAGLRAWGPATLLKRDSSTGVFLWN